MKVYTGEREEVNLRPISTEEILLKVLTDAIRSKIMEFARKEFLKRISTSSCPIPFIPP